MSVELSRIESGDGVRLTNAQTEHLDVVFASVGNPADLTAFIGNVSRLRTRLAEASRSARDKAQAATESLCGTFNAYQGRWPDPNLGVAIESYSRYHDILDKIIATGPHER